MVQFLFFSEDSYEVILAHLKRLELGHLDNVYTYEWGKGYMYMACYFSLHVPLSGKLMYDENEHGYPLYWKIEML